MNTEKYVVGFMFDPKLELVALIRKQKPKWQAGLLNGIGGKVEDGEEALAAICREFKEESGAVVPRSDWKYFCLMGGTNNDGSQFEVECFYTIGAPRKLVTMEAEEIEVYPIEYITAGRAATIGNLPWVVAAAVDIAKGPHPPQLLIAHY